MNSNSIVKRMKAGVGLAVIAASIATVAATPARAGSYSQYQAEIEGWCHIVQPAAETLYPYAFQYLNYSDQLDPSFQLIHKFSKYI